LQNSRFTKRCWVWAYEGDHGEIDLELNDTVNRGQAPYMGKLATLLKWHEQDPVDAFETRNGMI
jgi:endonuclease I